MNKIKNMIPLVSQSLPREEGKTFRDPLDIVTAGSHANINLLRLEMTSRRFRVLRTLKMLEINNTERAKPQNQMMVFVKPLKMVI